MPGVCPLKHCERWKVEYNIKYSKLLTAALFIIANHWKQPMCSLIVNCLNKQ